MRADRLLSIIMLLQTRGKQTAAALAERLEVSRRTILRDIDALSAAGVPIYADGGHGGGIALDENYRTSLAGLREREVSTLFVGANGPLLDDIGLGDAADSTLLKLLAGLPAAHRPAVEHFRQRFLIDPAWWWRDDQPLAWWEQLQQAVYEDRRIAAVYERHDGAVAERVLEPYSLVAKSSLWYLIAGRDGELRTYRVARFRQIRLLDERFERRAGFDLADHWRGQLERFGAIQPDYGFTLEMAADRLGFAQRIVPGRYRQLGPPDGRGRVLVRFQLESLDLAVMLVCGLAGAARVVEPADLRDAVAATARALLGPDGG
ncbi:MAG TPA: YafY family protein [Herpetosiphonaceae bacterium]|nr:YafY family protein [Herpetosiphonaceae bacterium]